MGTLASTAPLVLAETLIPAWLAVPPAFIVMLFLAGHVIAMQSAEMPVRRRRIRSVSSVLMMLITALIAYGVSLHPTTSDPRGFVLLWLSIASLLAIVVFLAMGDMLITLRQHAASSRDVQRRLNQRLRSDLTEQREVIARLNRQDRDRSRPATNHSDG